MAKAAPKKTSEPAVKHNWAMAAVWVVGGAILTLGASGSYNCGGLIYRRLLARAIRG